VGRPPAAVVAPVSDEDDVWVPLPAGEVHKTVKRRPYVCIQCANGTQVIGELVAVRRWPDLVGVILFAGRRRPETWHLLAPDTEVLVTRTASWVPPL